jgi:glucose-1-phosphate cytidylyltransferase
MRTVILAGGLGSRLAEETEVKPKPMVEIGGRPILWHIMQHYSHYGVREFVIALGYKGDVIKRYFLDYQLLSRNITIDLENGNLDMHGSSYETWKVHLIETGIETNTGGRVKRLEPWLKSEPFMLTYGDGLADVDVDQLLEFHRSHGCIGTVTAVRPPSRFGGLVFDGDIVKEFVEKPQIGEGWINGGFMVFEPGIFDYLKDDDDSLEADALEQLAQNRQLAAYRHDRFWQCMDTLRDKRLLENLWQQNRAPWKVWE